MLGKVGALRLFGSWDFVRADVWRNGRKLSRGQATEYLKARHGLNEAEATLLWREARAIPNPDAAVQWIARNPSLRHATFPGDRTSTTPADSKGAAVAGTSDRDSSRPNVLFFAPELADSVFMRLILLNGRGLRFYKPFRSEKQLGGGWIHTWRVEWP